MANYYGMSFPDNTHELAVEIFAYMYDERSEQEFEIAHEERRDRFKEIRGQSERVNRWYHFCNIVDILWNWKEGEHGANVQRVIWNDWTDRMLRSMIENDIVALAGCASCVDGATKIDLNSDLTIEELCEQNKRPTVQTLHGSVLADAPYLKGEEELFEYEFSNGDKITTTKAHRFLTPDGWLPASSFDVGSQLYGCAPSLPQTNLDTSLLDQQLNARHCSEKAEDCQDDYFACSRLSGELLREAQVAALERSPLQGDARRCIQCVYENLDGLSEGALRSRVCRESCHLSSHHDDHLQLSKTNQFSQLLDVIETSLPLPLSSSQRELLRQESDHLCASLERDLCSDHIECKGCAASPSEGFQSQDLSGHDSPSLCSNQNYQQLNECCYALGNELLSEHCAQPIVSSSYHLSCGYRVALTEVVSIKSVGVRKFYDLNVPVEHHYIAGGVVNHNSGKSMAASIYAIVQFICAPNESLILITSTSIKGAQLRVWKCLSQYWHALPKFAEFGEMVYSKCMIRGWDKSGKKTDSIGIQIVAAGSGSEKDAYDTLIGIKQERLYLIADELPQLPKMIIEAAFGNMVNGTNKDKQEFKMVAMGNPNLMTDAFGDMCEPIDGWNSVDESNDTWMTERGPVHRFDAERNPNITAGEELYSWYPSKNAIAKAKSRWGVRSLMFYKQYKAFWYREASTETIYSESEIVMNHCNKPYKPDRDGEVVSRKPVSAADPAFTQGGDEFPQVVGEVITNAKGKTFLEVTWGKSLDDDPSDMRPRSHKMVDQLRANCSKHSVDPAYFGYDATGTGIAFRDIVVSEWSSLCRDIQFGGSASTRSAGSTDTRKSCDVYRNRVSELWVKAKGLVREGRIRGLTDRMVSQMCARRYNTTTRSGAGVKICIESKSEMKKREGYSPDWADTFFILLETAILNGLIFDGETENLEKRSSPSWSKAVIGHDVLSGANLYTS